MGRTGDEVCMSFLCHFSCNIGIDFIGWMYYEAVYYMAFRVDAKMMNRNIDNDSRRFSGTLYVLIVVVS